MTGQKWREVMMSVCHRSAEMLVPKVKPAHGHISGKRRRRRR